MKVLQYFKEYLIKVQNDKNYLDYVDRYTLYSSQLMYEKTNDTLYLEFIKNYMDSIINPDGFILNENDKNVLNRYHTGKILFFLLQQSKEEKYYTAIESTMNQLKRLPRLKMGNFISDVNCPSVLTLDSMYMVEPFYMAYETIYNKKESYNDILDQFKNVRNYMFDDATKLYYQAFNENENKQIGNANLLSTAYFLITLIETIEATSIEIFEVYKALVNMFKETVKNVLNYYNKETKLFEQAIYKDEDENNYTVTKCNAMIAYAIIKACRLGVLSEEKYKKVLEEILANLFDEFVLKEDTNEKNKNCQDDDNVLYSLSKMKQSETIQVVNVLMMVYAESLLIK